MVSKHEITLGCHALIPGYHTEYGYVPTQAAGIAFLVLFGVSFILHTVQFCWKRTWWCSVFAVGCITELIGWGGRTWSSSCPYNGTAFLMQISTLIIAPVFFTAGIYILLGRFIQILGRDSSILSPKWYLWIFVTCDVISLVVQAIGGGMASSAVGGNGNTALGTHIMVAGIIFQLVSITIFVFFAVDFVRRTIRYHMLQSLTRSIVPLLAATVISLLCIYARSIYRTIELLQGWSGYLITHEKYFVALDGAMMVVAVGIFNVLHPGWLLPDSGSTSTIKSEESSDGVEMYVPGRT